MLDSYCSEYDCSVYIVWRANDITFESLVFPFSAPPDDLPFSAPPAPPFPPPPPPPLPPCWCSSSTTSSEARTRLEIVTTHTELDGQIKWHKVKPPKRKPILLYHNYEVRVVSGAFPWSSKCRYHDRRCTPRLTLPEDPEKN